MCSVFSFFGKWCSFSSTTYQVDKDQFAYIRIRDPEAKIIQKDNATLILVPTDDARLPAFFYVSKSLESDCASLKSEEIFDYSKSAISSLSKDLVSAPACPDLWIPGFWLRQHGHIGGLDGLALDERKLFVAKTAEIVDLSVYAKMPESGVLEADPAKASIILSSNFIFGIMCEGLDDVPLFVAYIEKSNWIKASQ